MRWLALGGAVGPALFVVVLTISAGLRPGYDPVSQFISELAATDTPNAALMNYAAFLPAGASIAAFGVSIAGLLPRSRRTLAAAALVTAFGVGIALSGVFSCDVGCPNPGGSLENRIHNRIAPAAFAAAIVGIALLASQLRRSAQWRAYWIYSVVSSVVAFACLVLLASSLESRQWTGAWQRLLVGTLFLWCAIIGVHAFRTTGGAPSAASG